MLIKPIVYLILLPTLFSYIEGYKILVIFPTGSYSHQVPQHAVSEGLADAGHHLTIITPNPIQTTNPNVTQIDINFTYQYMKMFGLSEAIGPYKMLSMVTTYLKMLTEGLLDHPEVAAIFRNNKKEHFDAIVIEALPFFPFYMAKEIFNTTLVGLTTLEMMPMIHRTMGNTIHPVIHPSFFLNSPKNPTLWDRIKMVYFESYQFYWEKYDLFPMYDTLIKKYFPHTKNNAESLMKSLDLTIEGVTPVLGNVRPLVPNTVQIGFLHIKPPKPCPPPLQKYLDESKNGVIYLSFGSNVKSAHLKPEIRQTIMNTLKRLKYDVLWKYENETIEGKPDNVRIEKWLPQLDLLAHKNIKLFITQGGLQSMDETLARGVPVVVIPFFADQDANAQKMENLGIGRRLDVGELTVDSLESNILEVINNPKYKNTVKQLGDRIRDTPMTPVKTAVWWIEYAIRNRGAEHLKYQGANIPFIEYYLIDVILVHLVALALILYIFKKLIGLILSKDTKGNQSKNKKMKNQ